VLEGSHWKAVSINESQLIPDTYISLYFIDGKLEGYSGLNFYEGKFETEADDKLLITYLIKTLLGGPENILRQGDAYGECLAQAASYRIEGDRLEIYSVSSPGPSLVLERTPTYPADPARLPGTHWQLVSVNGNSIPGDQSISLNFITDSLATGQAGYGFHITYAAVGDVLRVTDVLRTGDVIPEPGIQLPDYPCMASYLNSYHIESDRLEILTDQGNVLVYQLLNGDNAGLTPVSPSVSPRSPENTDPGNVNWTIFTDGNHINGLFLKAMIYGQLTAGGVVCWVIQNGTYLKYPCFDGLPGTTSRRSPETGRVTWSAHHLRAGYF
jgi:heat shock protein HslJ